MGRFLASLVGSIQEAWQELRIHKTRVMLSLIGVAVAVCSLATVVAMGDVLRQVTTEMNERYSGRPVTLALGATSNGDNEVDQELLRESWKKTMERYKIQYNTRVGYAERPIQYPDGVKHATLALVDQHYGEMHRVKMTHGVWFSALDSERLAPAVIVTPKFWKSIGSPDMSSHPTIELIGRPNTTAVIIGVAEATGPDGVMMLVDSYLQLPPVPAMTDNYSGSGEWFEYKMWIPPEAEEEVTEAVQRDIGADMAGTAIIEVNRSDYLQYEDDPARLFTVVIGAIAILVLILGALGLLNISLVTVKQRVREIGIRRASGATASRIFFSVMMESIVATVAAGAVGVMLSIAIMQSPIAERFLGQGLLLDTPPFPISAAILGMVSATVIGALAGLVPALYAVRVKVIDAIRF